jgi:hypothetical protein
VPSQLQTPDNGSKNSIADAITKMIAAPLEK